MLFVLCAFGWMFVVVCLICSVVPLIVFVLCVELCDCALLVRCMVCVVIVTVFRACAFAVGCSFFVVCFGLVVFVRVIVFLFVCVIVCIMCLCVSCVVVCCVLRCLSFVCEFVVVVYVVWCGLNALYLRVCGFDYHSLGCICCCVFWVGDVCAFVFNLCVV